MPTTPQTTTAKSDKSCLARLIQLGSNDSSLDDAQGRAARKLLHFDGEVYPRDGCAITLSTLLQDAGIDVPDTYQAIMLGELLRHHRNWQVVPFGEQQPGDVGSTCGDNPDHGRDHIYLVLKRVNNDEMLIADNQSRQPHSRFASGQHKTRTKFFLRAT